MATVRCAAAIDHLHADRNRARHGDAFRFVYLPDDDSLDQAKRVLAGHPPVYARRYLRIAIEIIVDNPDAL